MNRVVITDDYKNTVLDIGRKSIKGCSFYFDGRITPVNNDIFKLFNAFLLSKDNKRLPDEGKYRVMLDNKTCFKHYFIGDQEDFVMLYKMNGENVVSGLFDDDDDDDEYDIIDEFLDLFEDDDDDFYKYRAKKFKVGHSTIRTRISTFLIVILISSAFIFGNSYLYLGNKMHQYPTLEKTVEFMKYFKPDIVVDDLINRIHSSVYLNESQKELFSNRDFLEFILPYANKSKYTKFAYQDKFDNIRIKTFAKYLIYAGFYNPYEPSTINVLDSVMESEDENYRNKVLFHEFAHLCQCDCDYNLISEAHAEQMLEFTNYQMDSYTEQRYLVSKMMEIFGIDPIVEYVETNDKKIIKREVEPYLSTDEVKLFLSTLSIETVNEEDYDENKVKLKFQQCDNLLNKVYENKFGRRVDDDPVIPYLKDKGLVRYYFNEKKKSDGSYVIIKKTRIKEITMPIEESWDKYPITVILETPDGKKVGLSYKDFYEGRGNDLGTYAGLVEINDYKVKNMYAENGITYVTFEVNEGTDESIIYLPTLEEKFAMLKPKTI